MQHLRRCPCFSRHIMQHLVDFFKQAEPLAFPYTVYARICHWNNITSKQKKHAPIASAPPHAGAITSTLLHCCTVSFVPIHSFFLNFLPELHALCERPVSCRLHLSARKHNKQNENAIARLQHTPWNTIVLMLDPSTGVFMIKFFSVLGRGAKHPSIGNNTHELSFRFNQLVSCDIKRQLMSSTRLWLPHPWESCRKGARTEQWPEEIIAHVLKHFHDGHVFVEFCRVYTTTKTNPETWRSRAGGISLFGSWLQIVQANLFSNKTDWHWLTLLAFPVIVIVWTRLTWRTPQPGHKSM